MKREENRRSDEPGRRPADRERAHVVSELEQANSDLKSRRRVISDTFEQFVPVLAVAVTVLLVVCVVLSIATATQQHQITENQHDVAVAQARVEVLLGARRSSIAGACERLQFVRDDVNRISSAIYRVLTLPTPNPRQQPPAIFHSVVNDTVYLPPTQCEQAVDRPGTYRPPHPVPFARVARCYDAGTNPRPDPEDPRCHAE